MLNHISNCKRSELKMNGTTNSLLQIYECTLSNQYGLGFDLQILQPDLAVSSYQVHSFSLAAK